MKLLAFDTSSEACTIALAIDSQTFVQHSILPLKQASYLLPMIETLLCEAKVSLNQLDAIAVGCGPGSFTGIRIGFAVAQGLAFGAGLPLVLVSSLAIVAQSAYEEHGWDSLLVAIDARMNEVYWGQYKVKTSSIVELEGSELLNGPENIVVPQGNEWTGVGSGWEVYKDKFDLKPSKIDQNQLPHAVSMLNLAKNKLKNNEVISPAEALPVYLRNQVAFPSNK